MPRPARPLTVSEPGVFIGESCCALLQHALRDERHPVLAELRRAAYEVAVARTERQARASADASGLTVAQAAALLDVTPGRVRQLLGSGDLDGQQGAGRIWSITRESVEERRLHGDTSRA